MPSQKAPAPTEHAIQAAYIEWVRMNQGRFPELEVLHANVNGAALARVKDPVTGKWSRGTKQATKLLREGLLPGILDIELPVRGVGAYAAYIGLWLEFKRPGEKLSDKQMEVVRRLQHWGHLVYQVESTQEAITRTEQYLDVPLHLRTILYT